MRLNDLLRISFRQVIRQRRRNIGVILAIALGTAGFIVIITMGQDVKENLNEDLELLGGATRMKVYFEVDPRKYLVLRPQWFREDTIDTIRKIPDVMGVTRLVLGTPDKKMSAMRDKVHYIKVVGVDEHFWGVNSFSPIAGEFLGSDSVAERELVCVIGEKLAQTVFGRLDVVGERIPINKDYYRVVGILGGMGVSDRADWAFIPYTTYQDRMIGYNPTRQLYIRCRTWDNVEEISKAIPMVVRGNQPDEGLVVDVGWDRLEHVKRIFWWVQFFVIIAVVATLVLGGFGIWNIMMVAVSSRTREIGLKKAMGAEDTDILSQFMTEALCLSLVAAVVGIVLGRVGVEVSAYMLKSNPPEDLFILCVILGIIFSVILGGGAGLWPSVRASRMEVVTAVRYE